MEQLISDKNISNNKACKEVFGVEYDEICNGLTNIYNLPDKVAKVLKNDDNPNDPLIALIRESGHISNMLFSNNLGGEKAMKKTEARIKKNWGPIHLTFQILSKIPVNRMQMLKDSLICKKTMLT